MNSLTMKAQRETLYDEIWKEPMTTVAKRYGLTGNGLKKQCLKMNIPLPPQGYWAELRTGKHISEKPPLPPYAPSVAGDLRFQFEFDQIIMNAPWTFESEDNLDLLTTDSKAAFLNDCHSIKVPHKIPVYHEKIIEHNNEIKYRKERDKVYYYNPSYIHIPNKSEVRYQENKPVIPIKVSEDSMDRAYRIIETILEYIKWFGGSSRIEFTEKDDNMIIQIFRHSFSFVLYEKMARRRDIIQTPSMSMKSHFKPSYEKVFTGELVIEIEEYLQNNRLIAGHKKLLLLDSEHEKIEGQLGTIFIEMLRISNSRMLARRTTEIEQENKLQQEELERQTEKEKLIRLQEDQMLREKQSNFVQSIDDHMQEWNRYKSLSMYINDLKSYAALLEDAEEKKLLEKYIKLVLERINGKHPMAQIIKTMKELGSFGN